MNVLQRVMHRSGELNFDARVDTSEPSEDLRLTWINALGLEAQSVIDFGCWTGSTLSAVAPTAQRRVGLDIEGPWIDEARRRLPGAEVLAVSDFEVLPDALLGKFDLALLLDTLEHVPRRSQAAVLTAIRSSLRAGGTFVLVTPTAGSSAILDPAWLTVGHRHYRGRTVKRTLMAAGFTDVQIRYSGDLWTSLDLLTMYLAKYLLHRAHRSPAWISSRLNTGLLVSRPATAANVWAIAR